MLFAETYRHRFICIVRLAWIRKQVEEAEPSRWLFVGQPQVVQDSRRSR